MIKHTARTDTPVACIIFNDMTYQRTATKDLTHYLRTNFCEVVNNLEDLSTWTAGAHTRMILTDIKSDELLTENGIIKVFSSLSKDTTQLPVDKDTVNLDAVSGITFVYANGAQDKTFNTQSLIKGTPEMT